MKNLSSLILISVSIILISCNNTLIDDVKRGAGYNYQSGYPELRIEVSEHISEANETFLRVIGHVVENSLIFKREGDSLAAHIQFSIEVKNHESGKNNQLEFRHTINRAMDVGYYGEDIYKFSKDILAPPGNYRITVSVTDLATQNEINRSAEAFLPNPLKTDLNITNISLLTKKNQDYFNYTTTYDIGVDADSVKFLFQVTNNNVEDPITIQSRLIKFKSDTSHASPMSFQNPSASSIRYKGIDYGNYDVIQSSRREFRQPGNVVIEYNFPGLERGNYRFEVAENLDNKEQLYKARDFGVKSPNYPAIKAPRELVKPLVYIMDDKEYENMMEIDSPDSLKKALDHFWLSNIKNSVLARSVIALYYQRVEEANKMFSSYKEGWKTDMGKIYILFGPPLDEDVRLREVKWTYRFNQDDPDYTYYFRNVKTRTKFYPFHNYMLRRSNRYFNIEYRQRQLWLSGHIMTESL